MRFITVYIEIKGVDTRVRTPKHAGTAFGRHADRRNMHELIHKIGHIYVHLGEKELGDLNEPF